MLWAAGRYGLSDPSRQERQRCTIHALVNSANPQTLVSKYQQIAAAGKQLLRTDIPQEILGDFITLGLNYRTVENLRAAMSQKLGLQGSHALVRFAFEHKAEL